MSKQRMSVSVDSELVEAGDESVARGRARTLSAWVNDAMRLKAEHDRRVEALAAFIAAYETEHGEITAEEMRTAARRARSRSVTSRTVATREAVRKASPSRAPKAKRR